MAELLINAIEHGNLQIGYDEKTALMSKGNWAQEIERRIALPENKSKAVFVSFARHPDRIELHVRDQGPGFDWKKYMELDPARAFDSHGRGIALARQLSFQTLSYMGEGNEVLASIRL